MEFADILRALRTRWYLFIPLLAIAAGGAMAARQAANTAPTGAATVQILIDSPASALANLGQDPGPLASRASVFAQLMTSDAVVRSIAQAAGIPATDITAEGPYSGAGQTLNVTMPSEARGAQLIASKPENRLTFVAQNQLPIVTVSVQAPTPEAAGAIANAVYPGVEAWVKTLDTNNSIQPSKLVTLRQLGNAQAGAVDASSTSMMGAAAGAAILLFGTLAILGLDAVLRRRRLRTAGTTAAAAAGGALAAEPEPEPEPLDFFSDPVPTPEAKQRAHTEAKREPAASPDGQPTPRRRWIRSRRLDMVALSDPAPGRVETETEPAANDEAVAITLTDVHSLESRRQGKETGAAGRPSPGGADADAPLSEDTVTSSAAEDEKAVESSPRAAIAVGVSIADQIGRASERHAGAPTE